jgi:hypothetical protein
MVVVKLAACADLLSVVAQGYRERRSDFVCEMRRDASIPKERLWREAWHPSGRGTVCDGNESA